MSRVAAIDGQIESIRADELPPGIVIMAMASRLADMQTSRIDVAAAAINPPTTAPDAGRTAFVAETLLAVMYRRLAEGDSGPVSVAALTAMMVEEVDGLREEEVRFCARFLNVDRDIQYRDMGVGRWSRLLRYHPRLDYVKLTDAGRAWIRLLQQRSSWLFEDKDAEKIVIAIHSGELEQIPPVCAELITNLRQYNEELTAIMESPSFTVLVGRYLRHRQRYGDMLTGCLDVTGQAMELLLTEAVRLNHEAWQMAAGMDTPVKAFYDWIERVHRAAESLRRNWVRLIKLVQEDKRPMVGIVRFDLALDAYLGGSDRFDHALDTALLNNLGGWGIGADVLCFADLYGALPPADSDDAGPGEVEYDLERTVEQNIMQAWLLKHRRTLLDRLAQGPATLWEILADPAFAISCPSDISGAFGCYLVPDIVGGEARISVQAALRLSQMDVAGWRVTASDVRLVLHRAPEVPAE